MITHIELNQKVEEAKARDKTLAGSLASFIAEPFGINGSHIIRRVGLATRYFDTFTHLLDDAKDCKGDGSYLMHAATSAFIKGVGEVLKIAKNPEKLHQKISQYYEEASGGERHLWLHHGRIIPYNSNDFAMLGKRGSMAKVPIALYADISQNEDPVNGLEAGVGSAGLAVQLFDDIFDWKEDLQAKIYTHPIVLAHQKTGSSDKKSIERGLFYLGALEEVSDIALRHLKDGRKSFISVGATKMISIVDLLEDGIVELNKYSLQLRKNNYHGRDLTGELRSIVRPLLAFH